MSLEGKDQSGNDRMTSSYHEISGGGAAAEASASDATESKTLPEGAKKLFDRAKNWVGDLSLEGVVSHEGQQVTYVAEDLTKKIKVSKQNTTTSDRRSQQSSSSDAPEFTDDHFGPSSHHHPHLYQSSRGAQSSSYSASDTICDLNITVNDIEVEAKKLASCVDTLTENLTGILHSLSSMTMDCVFTASDGVTQLCDTADASIKLMYQVMAKCEELNKSVVPLHEVHKQIQDTKKLLDRVEAEIN
jgi:hypothetical protein